MPFYTYDNVTDSPINNFATWNPLFNGQGAPPFKDGNLCLGGDPSSWNDVIATFSVDSGLWYWECKGHDKYVFFGIASQSYTTGPDPLTRSNQISIYGDNGENYGENAGAYFTYDGTDIIGIFVDLESTQRVIKYYKNGTNSPAATINIPSSYKSISPFVIISAANSANIRVNFGQDPTFGGTSSLPAGAGAFTPDNQIGSFAFQPPAGALALCTANIPEGTIKLSQDQTPSDNFKAVTWTGQTVGGAMTAWDGTTGTVNVGFQPDFVWVKGRDNASWVNFLQDGVRGFTNFLVSNTTDPQSTTSPHIVSGVHTDGFYIKTNGNSNNSGDKYVAWCWRAAGSPADNQAKIINEDGSDGTMSTADLKTSTGASITPSKVSANRQNGFSIVKYTGTLTEGSGQTISHGLTTTPDLIIIKNRTRDPSNFFVWSSAYGTNQTLMLNTTGALINTDGNRFSGASSTTFSVGYYYDVGYLNDEYIAYCWHSVAGYSKFGSYVGNGSSDGPMVYCGFRPAFVMVKPSSTTGPWLMLDNGRDTFNQADRLLRANTADAETGSGEADLLSNGFKYRGATTNGDYYHNVSSVTYIYMAFAEQPFSGPSNAR